LAAEGGATCARWYAGHVVPCGPGRLVIGSVERDLRRMAVACREYLVMSCIPAERVRVPRIRMRSLDDAEWSIHAVGVAAVDGEHAELLNRDDHFSTRAIQGNSPALVRDV